MQKIAFSLVKGRLALGSPGWLVVHHHAANGLIHRKIVIGCPLVITIVIPFTKLDQNRNKE